MTRDRDDRHSPNPPPRPTPPAPADRVGELLRHAYDEVVAEPVPDSFAELLRKLG